MCRWLLGSRFDEGRYTDVFSSGGTQAASAFCASEAKSDVWVHLMCASRFRRATTQAAMYMDVPSDLRTAPSGILRYLETAKGCLRLGQWAKRILLTTPLGAHCTGFQSSTLDNFVSANNLTPKWCGVHRVVESTR